MSETKDLSREQGIAKLRELAMDARICHFVTGLGNKPLRSRPMETQEVDDEGNFWFLSGKSSDKNLEIEHDPDVQLLYANTGSSEYLSVFGYAEEISDHKKLEELWSSSAKAWFAEGKKDPGISVLKVNMADAYYWDTKNNTMVHLIKMAAGAVTGKTIDDNVQGRILR